MKKNSAVFSSIVDPEITGPLAGSGYKMLFRSVSKSKPIWSLNTYKKYISDQFGYFKVVKLVFLYANFSKEKFFNSLSSAFFYLKSRTLIQRYTTTQHTIGYEKFLPVDQDVRHLIQLVQNLKNSQLLISLHIHSFRFVRIWIFHVWKLNSVPL